MSRLMYVCMMMLCWSFGSGCIWDSLYPTEPLPKGTFQLEHSLSPAAVGQTEQVQVLKLILEPSEYNQNECHFAFDSTGHGPQIGGCKQKVLSLEVSHPTEESLRADILYTAAFLKRASLKLFQLQYTNPVVAVVGRGGNRKLLLAEFIEDGSPEQQLVCSKATKCLIFSESPKETNQNP